MPSKPPRPCSYPGCPFLVHGVGQYCEQHRSEARAQYDKERPTASRRGYDARWRELRKMILARRPLCADPFGTHAHDGQVVAATDVDHIVPKRIGGADTEGNLMPLCHSCHSRKTAIEGRRVQKRSHIPVTVIAGPPGAGKTTLVRERAQHGDLIVDVDALYQALSGLQWYEKPAGLLPFVVEARDAVLWRLGRNSDVRHAWVITSEASRDKLQKLKRALGAEVYVMETSPSECMRRIHQDERRKDKAHLWEELVNKWWEKWQGVCVEL